MRYLRANTATIVTVGPFYDKTDGVTIENSLTITNEKISMTVDNNDGSAPTLVLDNVTGATSGSDNDLNYISNCDAGLMQLELSAANTNHAGKRCILTVTDAANHVPVFHEFMILVANVYDAFIGTDYLQTHAVEITGDLITAAAIADNAIAAEHLAAGAIDFATFAADCKTGTGLKANVESISANAITSTAINADAITSAKIADDAISAEHLNTGAITADAFAANAIVAATLAADCITAAKIADSAIDMATLAADLKTGSAIKANVETVTAGAINAAAIANAAIDAATFAADADAEIAAMVWNAAVASYGGAGTYGQAVEDTLADTNELQADDTPGALSAIDAKIDTIDANVDSVLDDTGTAGVIVAAGSKTGYALAAGGTAIAHITLVERIYQMINNRMAVTEADGTVSLKNIGNSGAIASGNVASSSGTTTRAELSWS